MCECTDQTGAGIFLLGIALRILQVLVVELVIRNKRLQQFHTREKGTDLFIVDFPERRQLSPPLYTFLDLFASSHYALVEHLEDYVDGK